MKVQELSGGKLNYWVGKAAGLNVAYKWDEDTCYLLEDGNYKDGPEGIYSPLSNWQQAGAIIDKTHINEVYHTTMGKYFVPKFNIEYTKVIEMLYPSETPREAVLKAYVASVFGDEVPDQ